MNITEIPLVNSALGKYFEILPKQIKPAMEDAIRHIADNVFKTEPSESDIHLDFNSLATLNSILNPLIRDLTQQTFNNTLQGLGYKVNSLSSFEAQSKNVINELTDKILDMHTQNMTTDTANPKYFRQLSKQLYESTILLLEQLIVQQNPSIKPQEIQRFIDSKEREIKGMLDRKTRFYFNKIHLAAQSFEEEIKLGIQNIIDKLSLALNKACHPKDLPQNALENQAKENAKQLILQEEKEKTSAQKYILNQNKKIVNHPSFKSSKPVSEACKLYPSKGKTAVFTKYEPVLAKKFDKASFLENLLRDLQVFLQHARVQRWETLDYSIIRHFVDKDKDGVEVQHYLNLQESEIEKARAKHFLPGTERLIKLPQYREVYTFPTDRGYGMVAQLILKDKTVNGAIYFGISQDQVIFHKYFEEVNFKDTTKNLFKDQQKDEVKEDLKLTDWSSNTNFNLDISEQYVLKFVYSDHHQVHVFPLRKDLINESNK